MVMILGAVIFTAISWYVGIFLGASANMGADLGNLFAILVMGSFILYSLEKKKKE